MSIRVRGSSKVFTPEIILQTAINKRTRDEKYGIPLQIVYLDWNMRKQNFHKSKTKGNFEDLMITRTGKGLLLEYRTPGNLEWMKDGLTGEYSAMCPVTTKNIEMLASCYYDSLWTIRDKDVDAQVRKIADAIDEENKKIEHVFVKIERKLDAVTGQYVNVEKRVKGTLYDYHVDRRNMMFKGPTDASVVPRLQTAGKDEMNINEEKRRLDARERAIEEREKALGLSVNVLPAKKLEIESPEYNEEVLTVMHMGKLRKIARDEFAIADAFKKTKNQLIPEIMKTLNDDGKKEVMEGDVHQGELPLIPGMEQNVESDDGTVDRMEPKPIVEEPVVN